MSSLNSTRNNEIVWSPAFRWNDSVTKTFRLKAGLQTILEEGILMSQTIPDKYRDLFNKRAFANLATLMPDGSPQVTPVWCDFDGENVLINTAVGRVKDKNLQREPRVSMSILDPDNPYRYLEVRGRVVERTEQGADEHIDKMAKKYIGVDVYPNRRPGEVRVLYKIKPERISSMG